MAKQKKVPTQHATNEPPVIERTTPQVVRANVNRQTERSADFASYYVNDAQIQITPWDIRLTLGQITSVSTGDTPAVHIRELLDLRLSPAFAKQIAMVLVGQIRQYEQTVGPIALPPTKE